MRGWKMSSSPWASYSPTLDLSIIATKVEVAEGPFGIGRGPGQDIGKIVNGTQFLSGIGEQDVAGLDSGAGGVAVQQDVHDQDAVVREAPAVSRLLRLGQRPDRPAPGTTLCMHSTRLGGS